MDAGLKNKKALITGGGTGIGEAIAMDLAKEGVDIAFATRSQYPKLLENIKLLGVKCIWVQTDVSNECDVINMVRESIDRLEGLDFYINNAAYYCNEPITRITSDKWLKTINTNLSACVWACREVSKHFIKREHGNIVIVGSTITHTVIPKEASYRASKAGLKQLMELLSIELAPFGIRVNMVTPGLFATKLNSYLDFPEKDKFIESIPLGRAGIPDKDIGAAAVFLLSDKLSSYITGNELIVDGGLHIHSLSLFTCQDIANMNR